VPLPKQQSARLSLSHQPKGGLVNHPHRLRNFGERMNGPYSPAVHKPVAISGRSLAYCKFSVQTCKMQVETKPLKEPTT
jgi:hypothetical protein